MAAYYFDKLPTTEQFTIRKAINLTTIYNHHFSKETFPILVKETLKLLTIKLGIELREDCRISLSPKLSLEMKPFDETNFTGWMVINALVRDMNGVPHFASLLIWPNVYLGVPYPVKWEIKE